MTEQVLQQYNISFKEASVLPFGTGLINRTWKVIADEQEYILQQINHKIFQHPEHIDQNINTIGYFLSKQHPGYLFILPVKNKRNETISYDDNGNVFRLFPFLRNSVSHAVAASPLIAEQAALQFGRFTRFLSDLPVDQINYTLPDFHNISLRFVQFQEAISHGNPQRISETKEYIDLLQQQYQIVSTYEQIQKDESFKKRITHHDTKISNVLFDINGNGLCVIDPDTIMPGYFISDVGDMIRTYVCPVSEEECEYSKLNIRKEYFQAIVRGYLSEMKDELSVNEIKHFVYAGEFMIYMQALRFLTDYLNNDIYYGATYRQHNLVRAVNQLTLLQLLNQQKEELEQSVEDMLNTFS
ncbi:MAG: aminoglycoside phosphotransferase family protein [Bacteroidota bacterium]|nr:aminoglycoside phosphotransferase family protein [Bacteroidota bacterium]